MSKPHSRSPDQLSRFSIRRHLAFFRIYEAHLIAVEPCAPTCVSAWAKANFWEQYGCTSKDGPLIFRALAPFFCARPWLHPTDDTLPCQVPKDMDEDQLRPLFEQAGPIAHIMVIRDRQTDAHRGEQILVGSTARKYYLAMQIFCPLLASPKCGDCSV